MLANDRYRSAAAHIQQHTLQLNGVEEAATISSVPHEVFRPGSSSDEWWRPMSDAEAEYWMEGRVYEICLTFPAQPNHQILEPELIGFIEIDHERHGIVLRTGNEP